MYRICLTFLFLTLGVNGVAQTPTAPHALNFNGSTHAEIPDSDSLFSPGLNDFTISFWVYANALTGTQVLIEKNGLGRGALGPSGLEKAYYRIQLSGSQIEAAISDSSGVTVNIASAAGTIALNSWQRCAMVVDRTTNELRLIVDGVQVAANSIATVGLVSNGNPVVLGAQTDTSNLYSNRLTGLLDEIRFWDDARTIPQITSTQHSKLSTTTSGLIGYYQADQGIGTVLFDYSTSNKNGVVPALSMWTDLEPSGMGITGIVNPFIHLTTDYISAYTNAQSRIYNHQYTIGNGVIQSYSTDSNTVTLRWGSIAGTDTIKHKVQHSNWTGFDSSSISLNLVDCGIQEDDTSICNIDTVALHAFPVNSAYIYAWSSLSTTYISALDSLFPFTYGNASGIADDLYINIDAGGGNTCADTIKVTPFNDYVGPSLTVFNDTTIYVPDSACLAIPFLTGADSSYEAYFLSQGWVTDALSGVFIVNQDSGLADTSQHVLGATFNRFRAFDNCGNSTLASFTITILDTTPPSIASFADSVFLDATGIAVSNASAADTSSSDNCAILEQIQLDTLFNCVDLLALDTVINIESSAQGVGATQLNTPYDVAFDGAGNLYVCDYNNHRIQRWAPSATSGVTVAGGNGAGSASNQLHFPSGIHVTSTGDIYIADLANHRIQFWAAGASTGSTVAGGNGLGAGLNQLNFPFDVALDDSNYLYISDNQNHRIIKWVQGSTSGTVAVGGSGSGNASNQLNFPQGLVMDHLNRLYVADFANNRVQRFNLGSTTGVTVAGNGNSDSTLATLNGPTSVAVDSLFRVYVSERFVHRISKWTNTTGPGVLEAGGIQGSTLSQLDRPRGVALNSSNIVIADSENHRVVGWSIGDTAGVNLAGEILTSIDTSIIQQQLVQYAVTDTNGNADTIIIPVYVFDTIPPQLMVVNDTVFLDGQGEATLQAVDVNNGTTDNCSLDSIWTSDTLFNCNELGLNTVTFYASDSSYSTLIDPSGAFNLDSITFSVLVRDTIRPTALAQNIVINLDSIGSSALSVGQIDAGSTDNCAIDSMWLSQNLFGCADTGINSILLYVTDVSGNIDSAQAQVTVSDNQNPVVLVNNLVTLHLDNTGQANLTTTMVDAGSTDNCAIQSITLSQSNFSCVDIGINSIQVAVSDSSGNTTNTSISVSVVDTIKPSVSANNITRYLDQNGRTTISVADIDAGTLDNCSLDTLFLSDTLFTCQDIGLNTVSLTAIDEFSNLSTSNASVTILDTVKPTVFARDLTVFLDANGEADIQLLQVDSISQDNCSIVSRMLSDSLFSCNDVGVNTVFYSVTDASGNFTIVPFTVTVVDDVPPSVITQSQTVYLDQTGSATISVSDVNNGSTDSCGLSSLSLSKTTFNCQNLGSNVVFLRAEDQQGNLDSASAIITVVDTIAPIAVAQNLTRYISATGSLTINPAEVDNGSSDNCSIQSISLNSTSFSCANIGPNLIILSVFDNSGNVTRDTAILTIADSTRPQLNLQPVFLSLDQNGQGNVQYFQFDAGTIDNCFIQSTSVSQTTFDCNDLGKNLITITVTDQAGNTAMDTTSVYVQDNTSPVVVTQNVAVYLDLTGKSTINASDITSSITDNCGVVFDSTNADTFTCTDIGINQVGLFAQDASGNLGSALALVTVFDTISPTAVTQNMTLYLGNNGLANLSPSAADAGSFDNCSSLSFSVSKTLFTCADLGVQNVQFTVTDAASNTDQMPIQVTVLDTVAPSIQLQPLTLLLNGTGTANVSFSQIDNGSLDNCGIQSVLLSNSSFSCSDTGLNRITVTITDVNGNSSIDTALITIVDQTPPNLVYQNITAFLNPLGVATISVQDVDLGTMDNCGILNLSLSDSIFDCNNLGNNTITISGTDVNGNTSSAQLNVLVADTVPPNLLVQNQTVYLNSSGIATINPLLIDAGSTDQCGSLSFALNKSLFNCTDIGVNPVSFTATDASGNQAQSIVQITVIDSLPPVAQTQNLTLFLDQNGNAQLSANQVNNNSQDNCQLSALNLSDTLFNCSNLGLNTVTLMVSDASGNTNQQTATITVTDTISPQLVLTNSVIYLDANGQAIVSFSDVDGGSSDNCAVNNAVLNPNVFSCNDVGFQTITVTIFDGSSNSTSGTVVVEVRDSLVPTAQALSINLYLDQTGSAVLNPFSLDNGSADNCQIAAFNASAVNFSCADVGSNIVNFKVDDVSSNRDSLDVTVQVLDTLPPQILVQPNTFYLSSQGEVTLSPIDLDVGTTDNCTLQNMWLNKTTFNCNDVGSTSVTFYADDIYGNTDSVSLFITILDTVAPTTLVQTATIYLNGNGFATLVPAQINSGSYDSCGVSFVGVGQNTFSCADVGSQQTILTVQDVHGNFSQASAAVTIVDTVSPVIQTLPQSVYLDANGTATITAQQVDAGTTDNCALHSIQISDTLFSCADLGLNQILFTATDIYGNTSTQQTSVNVLDTIAPQVSTTNISLYLDAAGVATTVPSAALLSSTDNCSLGNATLAQQAFDCADLGENLIQLSVTDASGNVTSTLVRITVLDTVSPLIICPQSLSLCNNLVLFQDPQASDNCNNVNLVQVEGPPLGSSADTGSYTITYQAIDGENNSKFCSFNLQINPVPDVSIRPDTSIFLGDEVTLWARSSYDVSYQWTPTVNVQNPNDSTTTSTPTDSTIYTVEVTTPEGCSNRAITTVSIQNDIRVGTAFTPNGDGKNDFFIIQGIVNYPNAHLLIYNRNGQLVYESERYSNNWDGTYQGNPLPTASYYYILKLTPDAEGKTGIVTILNE